MRTSAKTLLLLSLLTISSCAETHGEAADPELSWVAIPGGSFLMGTEQGAADTRPVHSVNVPTFEILATEVTGAQYRVCVQDGSCSEPLTGTSCNWEASGRANHPLNCLDWSQAHEFCTWAGGRLPSEAEWEYAARSGGKDRAFPWGDDPATCDLVVMHDGSYGCGTSHTWPVCSIPAGNTEQGLCDMAGNVWEWVQDCWHENYSGAPEDGSAWEIDCVEDERLTRGGSFLVNGSLLQSTFRHNKDPVIQVTGLGFRCAR